MEFDALVLPDLLEDDYEPLSLGTRAAEAGPEAAAPGFGDAEEEGASFEFLEPAFEPTPEHADKAWVDMTDDEAFQVCLGKDSPELNFVLPEHRVSGKRPRSLDSEMSHLLKTLFVTPSKQVGDSIISFFERYFEHEARRRSSSAVRPFWDRHNSQLAKLTVRDFRDKHLQRWQQLTGEQWCRWRFLQYVHTRLYVNEGQGSTRIAPPEGVTLPADGQSLLRTEHVLRNIYGAIVAQQCDLYEREPAVQALQDKNPSVEGLEALYPTLPCYAEDVRRFRAFMMATARELRLPTFSGAAPALRSRLCAALMAQDYTSQFGILCREKILGRVQKKQGGGALRGSGAQRLSSRRENFIWRGRVGTRMPHCHEKDLTLHRPPSFGASAQEETIPI